MRVGVLTEDIYLYRKICLILAGRAEVTRVGGAEAEPGLREADLVLADTSLGTPPQVGCRLVTMGRQSGDLRIPFTREELFGAVIGERNAALSLNGRVATLRGKEIRLTEVEAALLSRLIAAEGEFVGRDELHSSVWQDADDGVLNVYIHYLREKLERDGEKIIISSRRSGYKIDAKFLKKEDEVDA